MTTTVQRHSIANVGGGIDGHAARVESITEMLTCFADSDIFREMTLSAALLTSKGACAQDPSAREFSTWESWVTAMQISCALFDAGMATSETVTCRIGSNSDSFEVPKVGPSPATHVGVWTTAVYLTVICRENDRLDKLMQVPIQFLRDSLPSTLAVDEFAYDWAATLQAFWSRSPRMWDHLVTAVKGTDPETGQCLASRDELLMLTYPPLELFQLLNRGKTHEFNASLVRSLELHREYWTSTEDRSLDPSGLVALAPLAIACMAYDNDVPIDVTSDFMPIHLLKRSWIGEFDT